MLWIRGGLVVDGRQASRRADVLVRDDRVEAVVDGGLDMAPAGVDVLEAEGLLVTPGFCDMHSHDDVAATDPAIYEAKVRQGVTTVAIGMDGLGYAPMGEAFREAIVRYWRPVDGEPGRLGAASLGAYGAQLEGRLGLHVVMGVPHGNVRIAVAGFALRPLTPDEQARAEALAAAIAGDGTYGLSSGLGYAPALASDRAELVGVARAAARAGGRLYVTHMRDYGRDIFAAVDEAVAVAWESGLGLHLSHLHLSHPDVLGRADELLERLAAAAAAGLQVSWDTYPYGAGSSILYSYLPSWAADGGPDALLGRLQDESALTRLERECASPGHGWAAVVVASSATGAFVGESVAQIASRLGTTPVRAIARVLSAEALNVAAIVHQTLEADDLKIAEAEACVVGSDGLPYGQRRHPRYSGAMAGYYRRHVLERRALTVEQAVERMAVRPAALLGVGQRGPVREAVADIAVWDAAAFRDQSTFEEPYRMAVGMRHVLVAGRPVLRDGLFQEDVRAGRWLRPR
jgi:N-acyl-D-amino-acid deacylase